MRRFRGVSRRDDLNGLEVAVRCRSWADYLVSYCVVRNFWSALYFGFGLWDCLLYVELGVFLGVLSYSFSLDSRFLCFVYNSYRLFRLDSV